MGFAVKLVVEELGSNQEPKRFKKLMAVLAVVNPPSLNTAIQTNVELLLVEIKALINSKSVLTFRLDLEFFLV